MCARYDDDLFALSALLLLGFSSSLVTFFFLVGLDLVNRHPDVRVWFIDGGIGPCPNFFWGVPFSWLCRNEV